MDEDASTRIAALEALVRDLAARLEEIQPAAERSSIESRLSALETRNAILELRLAEAEGAVFELADEAGGDGAAFETGGPTEPYTPGAHDEIEPDSKILKGGTGPHPAGNSREDKSLQWAPGATSVLQLHRFDQESSLVHEIPGPDDDDDSDTGNDDPIQFAGRVPKNGNISNGGELKWFKLKTTARPRLDTDETGSITTPGQSIDRESVAHEGGGSTEDLQLRAFADATDVEQTQGIGETGAHTTPDRLQALFRKTGGTTSARPKLVYVRAEEGPFWVKGADASQNFGTSIKLGGANIGYVTISVTATP